MEIVTEKYHKNLILISSIKKFLSILINEGKYEVKGLDQYNLKLDTLFDLISKNRNNTCEEILKKHFDCNLSEFFSEFHYIVKMITKDNNG